MKIEDTLKDRGQEYGPFTEQFRVAQKIKEAMRNSANWDTMHSWHRESLEMIAHKISRIVTGNPNHHDSWHDIEGYARLVSEWIQNPGGPKF